MPSSFVGQNWYQNTFPSFIKTNWFRERINTAKGKTLKITSKSPQLQKKFLYKKQLIFIKGRLGAKKGLAIPDDPPQLFLFGVISLNLGSPIIQALYYLSQK